MLTVIIVLLIQGLVIGAFARLALPGKDPLTLWQTAAVGIAGSFLAGLLTYAISGGSRAPSFLAALVFSVGIMYVIRRRRGGDLVRPSRHATGGGPFGRR